VIERAASTPRIAALLTSHNRRDMTVTCIERLNEQEGTDAEVRIFLLDAASSDGTAEAVSARFDGVTVLRGRADHFWNRGMHAAFAHAMSQGRFDFYLWVNDDTVLDDDALAHLLTTHERLDRAHPEPMIIVGATRDPETGDISYGGMRRSDDGSPLRFERVPPSETPVRADTMNGNFVLISSDVVERVGNLDPTFFHGLGDFDYGLRASDAGCSIWVAPGTIGTCRPNKWPSGLVNRLRFVFFGPKRMRFRGWWTFARRWGGRRWPPFRVRRFGVG
jgi:GT2 family glycosyltransferase